MDQIAELCHNGFGETEIHLHHDNDTPENLETIGDAGLSYSGKDGGNDLRRVLQRVLSDPAEVGTYRSAALERARQVYSWEQVTTAYETLFDELLTHSGL